jgi:hypothetical protein
MVMILLPFDVKHLQWSLVLLPYGSSAAIAAASGCGV